MEAAAPGSEAVLFQQSGLPTGLGYTPCFMLIDG